ncbi:aldose epimerase family protein [Flagellimonas flava]|uniref:Aldose 1-epimerase n=1 Tax=Flagellimonas flava TaxID=570519 RepID=A0A1M5NPZ3_9FLAO|nr:aldose epimerase [Allomuricauda flava]SHG91269.1 Aldose 1-epimerase [Allomuricauda flava]
MIHLRLGECKVSLDQGELVSFKHLEHEFIHQKGSPGWRSADTEMFPIIGPVNEANFRVEVPEGTAIQDQHGLLRELDYVLEDKSDVHVVFSKTYVAGTKVKNSKFPAKSTEEWLSWPYSFSFTKRFDLTENQLEISFSISGVVGMPFMLGYHPAFKIHTDTPIILASGKEITLDEVLAVGSRALQVEDCELITLKDKRNIHIKTEGFGHFMCWTEVRNMVCIEPISFYPYAVAQKNLHEGFLELSDQETVFKTILKV